MEHAHLIGRTVSGRRAALSLALLLAIALVTLAGRALLHRPEGTRPVPGTGRVANGPSEPVALRPRSAISVLVLNGSGISGAAGRVSSGLLSDGYRSAPTANAQVMTYARSFVLYRPGWDKAARRLARDTRIGTVAPLDGPFPAEGSGHPLVVILGR